MTARELKQVLSERIVFIKSNPYFEKEYDAKLSDEDESKYVVRKLYVDYEKRAIVAEVTHITFLIV